MLKAVLLLLNLFLSDSHQQCLNDDDDVLPIEPAQLEFWVESGHSFSASMFKYVDKERTQPNIIISPWGIQESLLLAYFGAETETEESLAQVLQIPKNQNKPLTWIFYSNQRELNLSDDKNSNPLKSANKMFLSNELFLRTCMEDKFQNELELIDYQTNGAWAQKYINYWVSNNTDGQIKNLIQNISPYSTATLVNAVFYKAKWFSPFNPNQTKKLLFHVNSTIQMPTDMMRKKDTYQHGYSKDLRARMLMLPYVVNRTAMIVLLPDEDLDAVIESLNAATLGYISDKSNYNPRTIHVVIPKYKNRNKLSLRNVLENLGMGNTFAFGADFSGFTGRKEVFFDQVVHEAAIEVDEEGTKAETGTGSLLEDIVLEFHFNRPFAYIIYDFVLSKVLLMGTFREP